MTRSILTLVLLLGTLSPVLALDCATAPDRTSGPGWRYRIIESRQCWYRNETPMLKSDLQWAAPPIVESPTVDEPLQPVLVRTVVYREVESRGESFDRYAIAILIVGFAFGLVIAGMVAVGMRGRA